MRNRWLAALFVVLLAGAPGAIDLCQMACAAAEFDGTVEAAHSCHEEAAVPVDVATVSLTPAPHICSHADDLPDGAGASGCDHLPYSLPARGVGRMVPPLIVVSHGLRPDAHPPGHDFAQLVPLRI